MTQPYWNPLAVNAMVQKGMPTCDNSRYPIQEFFASERSDQHHHYAHRLLGLNEPYFHFPWFWDLDPVHFNRPVVKVMDIRDKRDRMDERFGCVFCAMVRVLLFLLLIWLGYKYVLKR